MWQGTGSAHLTFLPRKPTPLGFMMKTVVCAESGICVAAELCEGAEVDGKKEFVKEYGSTAATTLRIVKEYFGSGRVVVADAWFGSYKLAYALRDRGIFSVMNVKNNTKRFVKRELLAECPERGNQSTKQCRVEGGWTVYGTCHMDKAPMTLVHTCGLSLPGPPRFRNWAKFKDGKMVRRQYKLEQPHVHSIYRGNFSGVDIYNKYCFGPRSLQMPYKTNCWQVRFWFACFSMCVTNAFHAHNRFRSIQSLEKWTLLEFKEELAEELLCSIYHPSRVQRSKRSREVAAGAVDAEGIEHILKHSHLRMT